GARKTKVVLAGQGVGPYRSCAYHSHLRWLTPGKSVTRAGPSRVRSVSRRLRSIGAPARHTPTKSCACAPLIVPPQVREHSVFSLQWIEKRQGGRNVLSGASCKAMDRSRGRAGVRARLGECT